MKTERVSVVCPKGHNIFADKIKGEVTGPVFQEFICPTCGHHLQASLERARTGSGSPAILMLSASDGRRSAQRGSPSISSPAKGSLRGNASHS